ncbi:Rv3654c family TadE-like protein [Corynebacterium sp. L4756]|uniref:Rv3654c family TadE-like protein n=1 Tax=unclassified Corynebacterium TaxID=2624378 RepID=UPI00374D0EAD
MLKKIRSLLMDSSGYATVASSGIIIAVLSLFLAVAMIISHVAAHHQAQVAADMAAIAGAFAHVTGEDGCAQATAIGVANNASVQACSVLGQDIQVTVSVRTQNASAKAGPI